MEAWVSLRVRFHRTGLRSIPGRLLWFGLLAFWGSGTAGLSESLTGQVQPPPALRAPASPGTPPCGPVDAKREKQHPVESDVLTDGFHVAEMRLSGSLCPACLLDLEKRLGRMPGMHKVKVRKALLRYIDSVSSVSPWAEASLVYDPNKLSFSAITGLMNRLGYCPYKIVDKIKQ